MIHALDPVIDSESTTERSTKLTSHQTRSLRILTALAIAIADNQEVTAVVSSRPQLSYQHPVTAATTSTAGVQVIAAGQSNAVHTGVPMAKPPDPPDPPASDTSIASKVAEILRQGYRTVFCMLRNTHNGHKEVNKICEILKHNLDVNTSAPLDEILPL